MNMEELDKAMAAEVTRKYGIVLFHLRMAQESLNRLGRDFGMLYGEDEDDSRGLINAAMEQVKVDRECLLEFVSVVNS